MPTLRLFIPLVLALLLGAGAPDASAQIAVRSALVDDRSAEPGTMYRGTVVLENLTDRPQEAKVTQRDYRFSADGANHFDPPGSHPRSNSSWIAVRPRVATLPPGGRAEVTYEVRVPAGGSLAGSYWSLLLVEPILPGSAESTLSGTGRQHAFGVREVTRFGVQVATHIGRPADPGVAVANASLVGDTESVLAVDLSNTGSHMTQPTLRLEVYDADGNVAKQDATSPSRLYPSTSVRHRLSLEDLTEGTYEALVIVDTDGSRAVGAQYTLVL